MSNKLNLGCGTDIRPGWINVDRVNLPGVDLIADLSDPYCLDSLPEDSVDEIQLFHILEHIPNPLPLLQELWRVAAPGCILYIRVPHGACDMAFADPQHVRQYFVSSFQFFEQPAYKRADYGYRGDWKTMEITMLVDPGVPSDFSHQQVEKIIHTTRNVALEIQAELVAIKPARPTTDPQDFNPVIILRKYHG